MSGFSRLEDGDLELAPVGSPGEGTDSDYYEWPCHSALSRALGGVDDLAWLVEGYAYRPPTSFATLPAGENQSESAVGSVCLRWAARIACVLVCSPCWVKFGVFVQMWCRESWKIELYSDDPERVRRALEAGFMCRGHSDWCYDCKRPRPLWSYIDDLLRRGRWKSAAVCMRREPEFWHARVRGPRVDADGHCLGADLILLYSLCFPGHEPEGVESVSSRCLGEGQSLPLVSRCLRHACWPVDDLAGPGRVHALRAVRAGRVDIVQKWVEHGLSLDDDGPRPAGPCLLLAEALLARQTGVALFLLSRPDCPVRGGEVELLLASWPTHHHLPLDLRNTLKAVLDRGCSLLTAWTVIASPAAAGAAAARITVSPRCFSGVEFLWKQVSFADLDTLALFQQFIPDEVDAFVRDADQRRLEIDTRLAASRDSSLCVEHV